MATEKKRRAIVSGAGVSGLLHALALRAHGVRIAAIYDPSVERAEGLANLCDGARAVGSLSDLDRVDAELACVCGPPLTHVDQAEVLARPGRVVFVEKPVATTHDELERLARLPGCVPIVQWRAGRALVAARACIAQGELGPSPVASADLAWSRDADYFATGKGGRDAWGCGALLSIGIHAVDALLWSLGRPVEALSGMLGYRSGVELETSAVAHFGLRGGALGTLRLTLDGGPDRTRLSFCGAGTTLEIHGGEADPTASTLHVETNDEARRARILAIEAGAHGSLGAPLLVPYLGHALAALDRGAHPGDDVDLPSIASVRPAHAAVLDLYAAWERRAA